MTLDITTRRKSLDERCSLNDAETLRKECVDILAVIEAWIAEKSEQG